MAWTEPSLDGPAAFTSEWVDVSFGGPGAPDVVLTLAAPGAAADPDDPLDCEEVPYDATWEVRFVDGRVSTMRVVPDDGASVRLEAAALLAQLEDPTQWSVTWRHMLARDDRDPSRWTQRVWTVRGLSLALADWAGSSAGRRDLQFRHRPEACAPEQREHHSSERSVLQIGDGLFATSDAFDALLATDPSEAADITREMQARVDHARAAGLHRPGE